MTGNEVIKKALTLLGYNGSTGEISGEQRFKSRSLTVLNAVYSDLYYIYKPNGFIPLESTGEVIFLPERAVNDVFPYGVAMYFAQSENDGDNQVLFSTLYNQKRSSLTNKSRVKDLLPTAY